MDGAEAFAFAGAAIHLPVIVATGQPAVVLTFYQLLQDYYLNTFIPENVGLCHIHLEIYNCVKWLLTSEEAFLGRSMRRDSTRYVWVGFQFTA